MRKCKFNISKTIRSGGNRWVRSPFQFFFLYNSIFFEKQLIGIFSLFCTGDKHLQLYPPPSYYGNSIAVLYLPIFHFQILSVFPQPTHFPYLNVGRYVSAVHYKKSDFMRNGNLAFSVAMQVCSIAMHFMICVAESANQKLYISSGH